MANTANGIANRNCCDDTERRKNKLWLRAEMFEA
jgi:hypothetical protein